MAKRLFNDRKDGVQKMDIPLLADLLTYRSFDPNTRCFYQENTVGFIVEVVPLCGGGEETYNALSSFIAQQLPHHAMCEIFMCAFPHVASFFDYYVKARKDPINQLFAQKRREYFENGLWQSVFHNEMSMFRDFQCYIAISFPVNTTIHDVIQCREILVSTLSTLSMASYELDANHFLSLISKLQYPFDTKTRKWDPYNELKDQMLHKEVSIKVDTTQLQVSENHSIQTFSVSQFPEEWSGLLMGECLGSLHKETLSMPCPFILHWVLKPQDVHSSRKKAIIKSTRGEQLANSSIAKIFPRAKKIVKDWQHALKALDEGERLVELFFQIVIISPINEAQKVENLTRALWQSLGYEVVKDKYFQLFHWTSLLPFMCHDQNYNELRRLYRFHTMLSSNAASLMPIQAEYKGTRSPCLVLSGRRGQVFFFDPFDNQGGNFNTAIAGKSGSGKSVLMQEIMSSLLGLGGKVFVLDVGRSFEKSCLLHEGEFIAFDFDNPISLNPFTYIENIQESLAMLKPLVAAMAMSTRKTDDYENALIEKALLHVWNEEGRDGTITSVATYLLKQTDNRAKDLSLMLFPYCKEGVYGQFFEGKCTLNFNNPLIVLELEELKSRKDLQQIVLMLLMYHVTECMYRGDRKRRTACIIDEAWDLLRGDLAGEMMETGCRRARKYHGAFITGTQSMQDFYQTKASQAAFENSDNLLLLAQKEEAIEQFDMNKMLVMDPSMKALLKSLKIKKGKYSELLIKNSSGFCVARLCLDPFARTLYSTTANVVAKLNDLRKQGVPLMDAVSALQILEE